MMLEEALEESDMPEGLSLAIRKLLDDWCKQPDYPEDYEPPMIELPDDILEGFEGPEKCPHGNEWHQCDACDHLSDLAYDAARERR